MENKGNKRLLTIVLAVVLAALICAFAYVFIGASPTAEGGEKAYVVEVDMGDGDTATYEGSTDAEYLIGLMEELSSGEDSFEYEASESEYGMFISSVNGKTADFEADNAYWAIYVNGEYGSYGADGQPVSDGDTFTFKYEVSE